MTTMLLDWRDALRAQDACREAMTFAGGYDSFQAAWDACQRGDWMLWWIGRTMLAGPMSAERRPLVRVACACARLALTHVAAGEGRPLAAIEIAERWAEGDDTVTRQDIRTAAAADAAAAAATATAYAADAAAYAYAAAATAADAAADAAAAATAAATAYAARELTLARCADIVRQHYPMPPERAQ